MKHLTLTSKTPPLLNKKLSSRFCVTQQLLACLVLLLSVGMTPAVLSLDFTYTGEKVEAEGIIITGIDQDMNTRVPARSFGVTGQAAQAAAFEVTYTGFTAEAQAAFQRAVNIASSIISSPVTIRVAAEFKQFESASTLGWASANYIWRLRLTNGQRWWFPDALADKLLSRDLAGGTRY